MSSVIVKVFKEGVAVVPKFSHCLVDFLNKGGCHALVSWYLESNYLVLSVGHERHRDGSFTISHSQVCPIKLATESKYDEDLIDEKEGNIPVAVCIVLESSDGRILLTKRPDHMRSSPGLWVPPGGHMETGETLLECGLRELREETGLHLSETEMTTSILGAWETVYPLSLHFGTPKSHALVIYYLVRVSLNHEHLSRKIIMSEDEVAAYTWLTSQALQELCNSLDSESFNIKQYFLKNGTIVETSLNYLSMYNKFLFADSEFYSGVQFALKTWLKDYQSRIPTSKF